ncbi:TRAP transporter small permease [Psychromonas sp. 14N.309.X.WAT.B.A12]|uniref:TRAP transporter small permease n=1 Tax=Psychromonas sp. 14N.309.X.WAT.B.A12 TaxID=2998322 RepID=UPI0025B231B3|nr:TRAP transporter small permease [Psychromonas sp. 14N.309.X.WAT.B.A12]MDN2664675.1 TRAP transporter small permease [Psychromonas sp. 14N.309.X.WAT.B.A12]
MFELISKYLDKIEGFFIASILAVASLLTFTQVFFRYALNDSIFWAEEAVLYLIISMSFLSTSLGVRKGTHITLDLLKSCLPPFLIPFFIVFSSVIGIAFAVALFYYGGNLFLNTLERGQLSPALRIPVASIYAFIPATALLQVFRYAQIIHSVVTKQPIKIESPQQ